LYTKLQLIEVTKFEHNTHGFNGPFSGTTQVSRYQKGKTNLDFSAARDSESQWHQLGHLKVCTSLQTDNHTSTPPLSFLQAGCPSCRPTNSVKALKFEHNRVDISVSSVEIMSCELGFIKRQPTQRLQCPPGDHDVVLC